MPEVPGRNATDWRQGVLDIANEELTKLMGILLVGLAENAYLCTRIRTRTKYEDNHHTDTDGTDSESAGHSTGRRREANISAYAARDAPRG
jgi:hypothetical protein